MAEAQYGNVEVKLANVEGCSLALPNASSSPISARWLLLNSCSSFDLIANSSPPDDIHVVDRPLNVQCNASTITVNKKGTLGTYPPKVWLNENGVANIL